MVIDTKKLELAMKITEGHTTNHTGTPFAVCRQGACPKARHWLHELTQDFCSTCGSLTHETTRHQYAVRSQ